MSAASRFHNILAVHRPQLHPLEAELTRRHFTRATEVIGNLVGQYRKMERQPRNSANANGGAKCRRADADDKFPARRHVHTLQSDDRLTVSRTSRRVDSLPAVATISTPPRNVGMEPGDRAAGCWASPMASAKVRQTPTAVQRRCIGTVIESTTLQRRGLRGITLWNLSAGGRFADE